MGLAVALIGCRLCFPHLHAAALRGGPLAALAAVIGVLSLSLAVDVAHIARVRTGALCGMPLAPRGKGGGAIVRLCFDTR